jgi:hypothetical protein
VLCVALVPASAVLADTGRTPLRAPTGYRDFCDGYRELAPSLRAQALPCPAGGVPARFWRPLRLPSPADDGSCPLSPARRVFSSFNVVLGDGPAYLLVGGEPGNLMRIHDPPSYPAHAPGWEIGPLMIPLRKGFAGPLLVRGAAIGHDGQVGVTGVGGLRPFAALQIPRGWFSGKSMNGKDVFMGGTGLWFSEPGCYAVQFDGPWSSEVVVFQTQLTPNG